MTEDEQTRYFRQLILPGFGEAEQEKLKGSAVLVVGAGGLGSPASLYLAAAGIGRLVICDHDRVELSNLNRQVLHGTGDLGVLKTDSAGRVLSGLNPEIIVETHAVTLDPTSIHEIGKGIDVIVDCLDNIPTRLVLNDFSIDLGIPLVHGGIEGWSGQVTLLHPPETPCLACLFEKPGPADGPAPVLGAVPGIIGATQALEVIKYITGLPGILKNRMLYFDGLGMEWSSFEIRKRTDCGKCGTLTNHTNQNDTEDQIH